MKPEDKATADRLTAAGTTQTPLTDGLSERIHYVVAKLDKLNPDYAAYEFVVPACYFRQLELALAASRAREEAQALREAELVRQLSFMFSMFGDELGAGARLRILDALAAPPTNSKEMSK